MGGIKHAQVVADSLGRYKLSQGVYEGTATHTIGGVAGLNIVRSATCIVAFNDSSESSKSMADYVGNGSNDAAQINAAIVKSQNGYKKVVLLEGNATIEVPIIIYPYTWLDGMGYDATKLTLADGANCNLITGATNQAVAYRLGVTISNMSLNGNKANQAGTSHGISLTGYRNSYLHHLRIDSFLTNGVDLAGGSGDPGGFQIVGYWIMSYSNGQYGFNVTNDNCDFHWCYGNTNTSDGWYINTGEANFHWDCQAEANGGYGFNVVGGQLHEFHGGYAWNNTTGGLRLYGVTRNRVFGGLYGGDAASGIIVGSSATVSAVNNKVFGAQISSNGASGLLEVNDGAGTPAYNTYKDNLFVSNTSTDILVLGTYDHFDAMPMSTALDLSGAASDVAVYHAESDAQLVGYKILYTEASSADAGVAIDVGKYSDGVALDDDYFDTSASESSKGLGYVAQKVTADLTNTLIAAGDTVTVGTAGGKTGTGEVKVILFIAENVS